MHQSHPNGETIKNRVMEILSDENWHDLGEFLNEYLFTARNRIAEKNAEWEKENNEKVIISDKIPNSRCFKYKIAPRYMAKKVKSGGGYSWKIKH